MRWITTLLKDCDEYFTSLTKEVGIIILKMREHLSGAESLVGTTRQQIDDSITGAIVR
jgi:hypothetical protein